MLTSWFTILLKTRYLCKDFFQSFMFALFPSTWSEKHNKPKKTVLFLIIILWKIHVIIWFCCSFSQLLHLHSFPSNPILCFILNLFVIYVYCWVCGKPLGHEWPTNREGTLLKETNSTEAINSHAHLPSSKISFSDFVWFELAQVLCMLSQMLWVHM